MESMNKRKNDQRDMDDYYSSMDDFVLKVRLTFANAIRYNDSSHQVYRFAQEMRQVFETQLKLFLQQDMKKASDDSGMQSALKTSSSVSLKRSKKETKDLKENRKEKIGSELLTRKRPLKDSASVLLQKPKEISVPSTASVVVTVSTPQTRELRKKKTRQQIGVEFGNQITSLLTEAASKGSYKFNIHNIDVDNKEVLKAKNSAIAVDDNSERSSGVVSDDLVKLSPNTALRIEAMKRRFAGTILRAEEKMADVKGRYGPSEVAKKEAMIKEEREKARMGLIEEEKNAEKNGQEIYNMKELEMLCGGGDYSTKVLLGLPLKKLGLCLKPDFDFAFEEEEEGEEEDEEEEDEEEVDIMY